MACTCICIYNLKVPGQFKPLGWHFIVVSLSHLMISTLYHRIMGIHNHIIYTYIYIHILWILCIFAHTSIHIHGHDVPMTVVFHRHLDFAGVQPSHFRPDPWISPVHHGGLPAARQCGCYPNSGGIIRNHGYLQLPTGTYSYSNYSMRTSSLTHRTHAPFLKI